MSPLVLFEDEGFVQLLPLTFWRTIFELRIGRKILLDRVAQILGQPISGVWTRDSIAKVAAHRCAVPVNRAIEPGTVLINGRWLFYEPVIFPDHACVGRIDGQIAFIVCDDSLANRLKPAGIVHGDPEALLADFSTVEAPGTMLQYPWDIIDVLHDTLCNDWNPSEAAIESTLDSRVTIIDEQQIYLGERDVIHPTAVLDASSGPVYISHDVEIGAFTVLEGPLYIGPGSIIRPHTWLHGGNSIGPVCKIGGELDGCVIHGYGNKQHSGFLGHTYVGSWCNIGAGTSNSDLKNTYGKIRVPINGTEVDSGKMFFGAVIGDHVKLGINSSIPTGAVVGFAACAAVSGFIPKYVPSFSWITDQGITAGNPPQLLDVATAVMARRNMDMTDDEIELFLDLGSRVRDYEASPQANG